MYFNAKRMEEWFAKSNNLYSALAMAMIIHGIAENDTAFFNSEWGVTVCSSLGINNKLCISLCKKVN